MSYETTFFQFSGGKDSIAALHLLRPAWERMTVTWLRTDAALPETIEYMGDIAQIVPHFLEVRAKQSIAELGYPADLVPTARSLEGVALKPLRPGQHMFRSKWDCCLKTISFPLHQAMLERGARVIIRGSKKADGYHSPIEPGQVFMGIRYELPLWKWSDRDVREYLAREGIELPDNYQVMDTGLDCWNCTAYLYENRGKLGYLREHHPEKFEQVRAVLTDLEQAILEERPHVTQRLDDVRNYCPSTFCQPQVRAP